VLVFGHVAAATVSCHALDRRADLRWVIFLTLVADIVDKPLGLWVFKDTINNGRVWFHSIAVNLLLTMVLLLARKPGVYALSLWLHQFCDRMWMRPWVALWPFTGRFGYRYLPFEDWVYGIFNPYNVVSDVVGLGVLLFFVWRFGLFRRERLADLVRTGRFSRENPSSPPG
jgi:hypothetical protein